MFEAIVATCRSLACDARLAILYQLTLHPELPSLELAERAALTFDDASHHLAQLAAHGLLERRRSGARVFYLLGASEPSGGPAAIAGLVRRACHGVKWATTGWREKALVHVSAPAVVRLPAGVAKALDVVFDAATAFTHARRLMILRFLTEHGPARGPALTTALKMSRPARERHLDKLERRGYVHCLGRGTWALSTRQKTRFHAALLREVAAWGGWPGRDGRPDGPRPRAANGLRPRART